MRHDWQAALANARLAYEIYAAARSSDRWKVLSAQGASYNACSGINGC